MSFRPDPMRKNRVNLFEVTKTSLIEMDGRPSNSTPEPNSSEDEGIPEDPEEELLSQYEGEDAMETEDQDLNNGGLTAERIQEIMQPYYRAVDEPWTQHPNSVPKITLAVMIRRNHDAFRADSKEKQCGRPGCNQRS